MNTLTIQELQFIADRASDVEGDVRVIRAVQGRDGSPIGFRMAVGNLLRIGVALNSVLGEDRATALADAASVDILGGSQTVYFPDWTVAA